MASDGCDRARRMANRIAAAKSTHDRFYMLQFEQRTVGDLGSLCRGVCINCPAGLSFPHERSGTQEKREGQRKRTVSGLTAVSEIAFFSP